MTNMFHLLLIYHYHCDLINWWWYWHMNCIWKLLLRGVIPDHINMKIIITQVHQSILYIHIVRIQCNVAIPHIINYYYGLIEFKFSVPHDGYKHIFMLCTAKQLFYKLLYHYMICVVQQWTHNLWMLYIQNGE